MHRYLDGIYRRPEWSYRTRNDMTLFPAWLENICRRVRAQSDHTVSVQNSNNWQTAMSEAAFMTGLERNADVVRWQLCPYSPMWMAAMDADLILGG